MKNMEFKNIKKIVGIPTILTILVILIVMTGCNRGDDPVVTPPPPPPPSWTPVKISLEADIEDFSIVKSAKSETDDKVGLFMKKNQQNIADPGAVFENVSNLPVTLSGKNLVLDEALYYPETGHVDFMAYYPYSASIGADFTVATTVATDQTAGLSQEILFSRNAVNRPPSETPVMLNFDYSLIKLAIHVTEGKFETLISDFMGLTVSIDGLYTQAKLHLENGTFTEYSNPQRITFYKTVSADATASFEALVLPAVIEGDDITLVFSMGGEEYVFPLKSGDYDAGMQYELNFKLSEFDVVLLDTNILPREIISTGEIIGSPNMSGMVTTLCGRRGTTAFTEGTLGQATFNNNNLTFLACDTRGNLYFCHQTDNFVGMVDLENHTVRKLMDTEREPNAPCMDPTGNILWVPMQGGNDDVDNVDYWRLAYAELYPYDPENEGDILLFTQPPSDDPNYFRMRNSKHSFAYCPLDDKIYMRGNQDGQLIRFDPATGDGEGIVDPSGEPIFLVKHPDQAQRNPDYLRGDGYLAFDPDEPNMLYAALNQRNCIARVDILTGEYVILVGDGGSLPDEPDRASTSGYRDGFWNAARFSSPRQIAFMKEPAHQLLVADQNNHCIRQVDVKTGMVTTFAGTPWKGSGYRDGQKDRAQFEQPFGVAVDPRDGAVYVGDRQNRCIRKIWP